MTLTTLIDLGSHQISCWMVKTSPEVEILGAGYQKTQGYQSGHIEDLVTLEACLLRAIQATEKSAQRRIKHCTVLLSGPFFTSGYHTTQHTLTQDTVTAQDMSRITHGNTPPQDSTILHTIPLHYTLDDQKNIQNPLGMAGTTLHAYHHCIALKASFLKNIILAFQRIGTPLRHIFFSGYGASYGALTTQEKEQGATLIDIGGGGITLTGLYRNKITDTAYIPLGGRHITQDIRCTFPSLSLNEAERLKILYFLGKKSLDQAGVSWEKMHHTITSRVTEISHMIGQALRRLRPSYFVHRHIVCVGGQGTMPSLLSLLQERFDAAQIRIATLPPIPGIIQAHDITHAALYGMALYVAERTLAPSNISPSWGKKILYWLKNQ